MIWGVVPYAPYYHNLEAASVCPQNGVTSCPYHYYLYHLRPHVHVPVPPALLELVEEVHQTRIHHKVRDLLAARVLGFAYADAEIP